MRNGFSSVNSCLINQKNDQNEQVKLKIANTSVKLKLWNKKLDLKTAVKVRKISKEEQQYP